jgi:hypothetical protein
LKNLSTEDEYLFIADMLYLCFYQIASRMPPGCLFLPYKGEKQAIWWLFAGNLVKREH